MTVGELMERLEELDEDMEVRLMTQRSWPFQSEVQGLCQGDDLGEEGRAEVGILYIVEGDQIAYGDKAAWEVAS